MDADSENEAPAIRALGSLFKLTEVFLWEDATMGMPEVSSSYVRHGSAAEHISSPSCAAISLNSDLETNDYTPSTEDMELSRQMNALGLPVCFSTNKKKKGKGTHKMKHLSGHKENVERHLQVSKASEVEVASPIVFHDETSTCLCCKSTPGQSETLCCDVAEGVNEHCDPSGDKVSASMAGIIHSLATHEQTSMEISVVTSNSAMDYDTASSSIVSNCNNKVTVQSVTLNNEASPEDYLQDASFGIDKKELDEGPPEYKHVEGSFMAYFDKEGEKLCVDIRTDKTWVLDSVEFSQASDKVDHVELESCTCSGDSGEWTVFWDSFYMRNYFYNIKTHESTWYPPPGMEHLAFSDSTPISSEMITDATERDVSSSLSCEDIKVLDPCVLQDKTDLFEEIRSGDTSLGQPFHEASSGIDLASGGFVSGLTPPTKCCSCELQDDLNGVVSCTEAKKISDEEFSLFSFSSSQDHIDSCSSGDKFNQLGYEEVWRSDQELTFTNSKIEELDLSAHLRKPEEVSSCEEAHTICDDITHQVLDAGSLTTRRSKAGSEEILNSNIESLLMTSATNELDSLHDPATSKRKKKVRRTRSQRKISSDDNEELPFQAADITKYWCQRYLLFSRFDDGIKMDREGWFSVTPEPIARHHASRCGSGIIVDCFTGVGGNAIQFAKRSNHVIAIDIDSQKIDYAQHNAAIYGVDGGIDFILGDYFQLAPKLKADTVFLSPPWGGPDYAKVQTYNIKTMLQPCDGYFLFNTARGIASRVVMFLPRNVDLNQLAELSLSAHPPWALEVEKNFLNGKLKAITAYFNDTSVQKTDTEGA